MVIPLFKFVVQLNPEYARYFTSWDMNQVLESQIDAALLSIKSGEDYLRKDDLVK